MLRSPEQIEAREEVMRMKMQRLVSGSAMVEPVPTPTPTPLPSPKLPYSTPKEVAKRWHVSANTIRRWFRDEPGVLQWGRADSRPGKKRAHLSIRIPPEVEGRVRRRMARD